MISFVHALCGMLYNIYHWYCGVLYNIYNWYLIVAQPWWALVTSPLAQGGRLGKYREVTHVAPGHLNWNLVIWASLSTGLQGRGTVPPRVFDGIAGYVWVCVGGLSLYANTLHVVRGGVELMCTRRPGSVEGEGVSTWPSAIPCRLLIPYMMVIPCIKTNGVLWLIPARNFTSSPWIRATPP